MEYSKTRTSRDIYVSDETTYYLKQWLNWKYNANKIAEKSPKDPNSENLVFSIYSLNKKPNPSNLYVKLLYEFQKLLGATGMAEERKAEYTKEERSPSIAFGD